MVEFFILFFVHWHEKDMSRQSGYKFNSNKTNKTSKTKTKKKLVHMALTPNIALKDLILKWCETNGVSIPDPSRLVQLLVDEYN